MSWRALTRVGRTDGTRHDNTLRPEWVEVIISHWLHILISRVYAPNSVNGFTNYEQDWLNIVSCRAVMRTGQTDGQEDGQTDIGPKVRQYPTAWIGQGSTLGYIFSSYFNNLRGHHFWVIFRILTILWSWKIQHISIPHVNLLGLWMKSVNSLVPGRHKNSKYNCEVQIRPEMLTCDSTENCSLYNPRMAWHAVAGHSV